MSIEELISVVEPPDPWDGGDESRWEAVQAKLGIALPRDYFDLAHRYGSGHFYDPDRECIHVLNPFSPRYFQKMARDCDMMRPFESDELEPMPYKVFPTRPGLLPWGWDENGWALYWLTEGSPDHWPLLLNPPREHLYFERIEMSLTSFLAESFSGRLETNWKSPPFFTGPEPVRFIPEDCPISLDPECLTPTVREVAEAIQGACAFDRLPILADALEDAGCTNADVLNHCRQPGEHVRGCWVVDLLLGKS